jgi:hypothetical protein
MMLMHALSHDLVRGWTSPMLMGAQPFKRLSHAAHGGLT